MPTFELALPAHLVFLPGLALLLVAAGLFAALGRWFDTVPRPVQAWIVALVVGLLGPALFFGHTVLPVGIQATQAPFEAYLETPRGNRLQADLLREVFPATVSLRHAVADGEWPLLAPYTGPGMPLLADPQSLALQPTSWLTAWLPPLDAMPLTMALRLLLALTFTFVLLRRLDLAVPAAAFGAASFGLSAFVALWLGWPLANSAALLPAVLYGVQRLADRGGRRDVALLGVALFTLLTGGHPETILHVLLLGVAFALDRALALWKGRVGNGAGSRKAVRIGVPRGRELWSFLWRGAAAGVVALALAAPVLLPAVDYLPQTMRARMVQGAAAHARSLPWMSAAWTTDRRQTGWPTWEANATAQVAPNAFGNHAFGDYWGPSNSNSDSGGFAGTLALAGALAVLGFGLRRRPGERLMLVVAAVTLAITLRIPPTTKLLFSLPLLDRSITAHGRMRILLAFALCYLAAASLDRWLRAETTTRRWAVAVGIAAGLAAWGHLAHPPGDPEQLIFLRLTSLTVQLTVALLGLLALRAADWRWHQPSSVERPQRKAWGVALITGIAAAELLFFHLPAWPPMPREVFPETPEISALQEFQTTPDAHRVVGLGATLLPNQQAVYGLPSPGITGPLKPAALNDIMAPLLFRAWSGADHFTARDHPLYQLLGVRYMLFPHDVRPPKWYSRRYRGLGGRVFERPGALPVAWLPESARRCTGGWTACLSEITDFATEARVEEQAPAPLQWLALADPPYVGDSLENWTYHGASHRSAEATLWQRRLLATSIFQDGGWRLLLDGEPRRTFLTNGPFIAAALPPGEHRLDLVHRPPGFLLGLLLAALGLAAVPWVLVPPRLREAPR